MRRRARRPGRGGSEVTYQALREMPRLESAIKEALRLHPPLILLLRLAKEDVACLGFGILAGQLVAASPAVSNRIPEDFPDAERFVPSRYLEPRARRPRQPLDLDPLRGGPPPLRGGAVRHDAAEGDLLGPPRGLGVRTGPAARHLPQRPLEDGGPARSSPVWSATGDGTRPDRRRGERVGEVRSPRWRRRSGRGRS